MLFSCQYPSTAGITHPLILMDKSSEVLSSNSIWLSQNKSKTIGKAVRDGGKILLLSSADLPVLENVAGEKKKKEENL